MSNRERVIAALKEAFESGWEAHLRIEHSSGPYLDMNEAFDEFLRHMLTVWQRQPDRSPFHMER